MYCDESVSRGRMTGTKGRGTGTIGTKGRTEGTKGRGNEKPYGLVQIEFRPGNEYPPCVDMAGTSDPFSRCVIVRD